MDDSLVFGLCSVVTMVMTASPRDLVVTALTALMTACCSSCRCTHELLLTKGEAYTCDGITDYTYRHRRKTMMNISEFGAQITI